MSLQPEHLPLTLKESGEQRLETFADVDQKVKEALAPNKKLLSADLQVAGLNIPEQLSFELKKKGETLSQHLAQDLFHKAYPELTKEEKYFTAVVDAILKQNEIFSDHLEIGDIFAFDFGNGLFVYDHRESTTQHELLFKTPEELTQKSREEAEALIRELEEHNILYDAMRRFNDDASFEGRVAYIEKHKDSFVDTINLYISDPKQKLDKAVAGFGYRGCQTQNIAYLKAYLALKRQEKLGEPLPQPEAPAPEPAPVEPAPLSPEELHAQEIQDLTDTLNEVNSDLANIAGRLDRFNELDQPARENLKTQLNSTQVLLNNVSVQYDRIRLEAKAFSFETKLQNLKDLQKVLARELSQKMVATPLPEAPTEEQIREMAKQDWSTIEQEAPYSRLLVLNERMTTVIHGFDALSAYLMNFESRPETEKATAKAKLEELKTEYEKIVEVNHDLGELKTPPQKAQQAELLRVLTSYAGTYAMYAEVFYKVPEPEPVPEPVPEPAPAPTPIPEPEPAVADADVEAEVQAAVQEALKAKVKTAGESLGLRNPLMTAEDFRVEIEHYKNNIPNQVNALSSEFTANDRAYVEVSHSQNRLVNEGSSSMTFELQSQDGKIYTVRAETLPVDMAAVSNYITVQNGIGQSLDRDQVIEYLTYEQLSAAIQKEVEDLKPKIEKDLRKFERKGAEAPEAEEAEAAPSTIGEIESKEHRRLEEEIARLAGKNAWDGVERTYEMILELRDSTPTAEDHYLAAMAARNRGDINLTAERLAKAVILKPIPAAQEVLAGIKASYGKVQIDVARGVEKSYNNMQTETMPFSMELRQNIQFVQKQVLETGHYEGYLAVGTYNFNGKIVEVRAGEMIQVVNVE